MAEMKAIMEKPGKPMPDMSNVFSYILPLRGEFETAIAAELSQPLLSIGMDQALIDQFIAEVPPMMFPEAGKGNGPDMMAFMKWGENFPEAIREDA